MTKGHIKEVIHGTLKILQQSLFIPFNAQSSFRSLREKRSALRRASNRCRATTSSFDAKFASERLEGRRSVLRGATSRCNATSLTQFLRKNVVRRQRRRRLRIVAQDRQHQVVRQHRKRKNLRQLIDNRQQRQQLPLYRPKNC